MPTRKPLKSAPGSALSKLKKIGKLPAPSRNPVALPVKATSGNDDNGTMDLDGVQETGAAPANRVKDAGSLYRLFVRFAEADQTSAHNRRVLQDMIDGAPPHKDHVIKSTGMGWRYNLNFLEADSMIGAALTNYDDLVDSVENLILPFIRPEVMSVEDRVDQQDTIAEEWTTLIREDWPQFPQYWTRLATAFVGFAVGFATFPDDTDFRWKPGGWDDFLMPRRTECDDEAVTVLIGRHSYRADELYGFISGANPHPGWNGDEVRKALVRAARGDKQAAKWDAFWPGLEFDLKDNAATVGLADAEMIEALHYWVREYDGSISFYIGLEDGTNTDHLYAEKNRYESANEAFVTFTFNVGKGTFHSIRGLAWKMFPFVQVSNRMRCSLLDSTDLATALLLQPADGDSLDDLAITLAGPVGYIPAEAKVVERSMPNVGTQALPVIADLSRQLSNATGQYQVRAVAPDGQERTKYEIQAEQANTSALGSSAVNRFYRSITKLFAEQFRRVQKIGPSNEKFPQVKAFYERCAARGVTAEVIQKHVYRVVAVKAIGNGSQQARLLALDELNGMAGALDDTGRRLAARDRIASRFGRDIADRYLPKSKRLAPDDKVAGLENGVMVSAPVDVSPDEDHAVHLNRHVPAMLQLVEQLMQMREQNPQADFRTYRPQVDYANRLHDHSLKHVQLLAADPSRAGLAKTYNAALEQSGNLLSAFGRQLDAQDRQAQQDQQDAQAPDAKLVKAQQQAELHQQELVLRKQKFDLEQQMTLAEVTQRMQLRQKEADARMSEQILKNGALQQEFPSAPETPAAPPTAGV